MSKFWNRKGAQALFLFFGLLVSAWASGTAEAAVWHWACALILLAIAAHSPGRPQPSWIGAAVGLFAGWTLLHTAFIAESYSPAGLFQPLFLVCGFALGRRNLTPEGESGHTMIAMTAVAALACFSLSWSAWYGTPAAAPFETPAVLAALINLALLPALVTSLWGKKPPLALLIAQGILFAGLVGASSRGGWIGLMVGLAFAALVLRGRLPGAQSVVATGASALLGIGLAMVLRSVGPLLDHSASAPAYRAWAGLPAIFGSPPVLQIDSSLSRFELYSLAFDSALAHLPFGSGYLSFAQILEAGRERVPSYGSENVTYFVHSDYLQTLIELGLPGSLALLVLVLLPLALLVYNRDRLTEGLVPGAACAAALAAMAFQASVDFPFYIPVCLAVFGLQMGRLEAIFAHAGIGLTGSRFQGSVLLHSLRRISIALGLALLAIPIVAELSLAYGKARWKEGLGEEAAYGFELARRLQPSDWRFAWFAGKFWTAQAAGNRNAEAARLADASFASGFASSPLEARNLLGRIEVQRTLGPLLGNPVSAAELESWADRALALAPLNPRVRTERIFVLEKVGKTDAARAEAARFARDEPNNKSAWFLAERLARRPH